MIGLIQLVTHAQVEVDEKIVGSISRGILAFIGMEKTDKVDDAEKLLDKIICYRIFPDENGKMNLSLKDVQGGLLLVPQFTLVAETQKGTRPGFSVGMPPEEGKKLFTELVALAQRKYADVASGIFGAYMKVDLCNDGPATFILQSRRI